MTVNDSAQFYELARKEIGALILSDEHPNIVRCFAMEEDNEFVYLALERCRQSLADLVTGEGGSVFLVDEAKHPTPFCIQVGIRAKLFKVSGTLDMRRYYNVDLTQQHGHWVLPDNSRDAS